MCAAIGRTSTAGLSKGGGWSYDELLPYFVRTEDQQRSEQEFTRPWHGRGGPLTANNLHNPHPVSLAMVQAAIQAGMPACKDFNNGHPDGAGLFQVNLKNGQRSSVAKRHRARHAAAQSGCAHAGAGHPHRSGRAARQHGALEGQGRRKPCRSRSKEVLLCAGACSRPSC
jgi:choline dehydrogenase